jgi:hypothetical protein
MTVTTVRPNVVHSGVGNYTETGAANIPDALNDDSDATYIRKDVSGTADIIVGLGTFSLTSSQIIKQVRLRARAQTPTAASKVSFALGTRTGGSNFFTPALTVKGVQSTQEFTGAYYTSSPDGATWNQARLDALRIQVTDFRSTTDRAYIYELYADVDVANAPSASVSAPTASVTTTAKPDVSWSYTDTDGDGQSFYQVKVFTAAQYTAGDFDPASSTATWNSGQVNGSDTTTTVGDYLLDGTYRAYVRVAKTINGEPFWSSWAYSEFVVDLVQPTSPTLSVSFDSGDNKVGVVATGASAAGYDYQVFEVQRSTDQTTWVTVRDAADLSPNTSFVATINDYEAPRGVANYYRARSIAYLGDNVVASDYGASASVTVTNDGSWWMKAITAPSLNVGEVRILEGLDELIEEDLGIFRPKGRTTALVVSGSLYGRDGTYRIVTSTTAEWNAIYPVARHQGTILVQDPFGDQKYVRITARKWQTTGAVTALRRQLDLSYVEASGD